MNSPDEQILKLLKWNKLASFSSQTATDKTVDIEKDLDKYNEFLVTLGPVSTPERVLNNTVVPANALIVADNTSGYVQLTANDGYFKAGLSRMDGNKLKLYVGNNAGISVYAR